MSVKKEKNYVSGKWQAHKDVNSNVILAVPRPALLSSYPTVTIIYCNDFDVHQVKNITRLINFYHLPQHPTIGKYFVINIVVRWEKFRTLIDIEIDSRISFLWLLKLVLWRWSDFSQGEKKSFSSSSSNERNDDWVKKYN